MRHFFFAVFLLPFLLAAGAEDVPHYRIGAQNRIDFFSGWDPSHFPMWPAPDDDHVTMTFMGLGRFVNAPEMKKNGNEWKGVFTYTPWQATESISLDAGIAVHPHGEKEFFYEMSFRTKKSGQKGKPYVDLTFNKNTFGRDIEFIFEKDGKQTIQFIRIDKERSDGGFIHQMDIGNPCIGIRFPMIHGMVRLSGFRAGVSGMKYSSDVANLRIFPEPDGAVEGRISIQVDIAPFQTVPFDLSAMANMGFSDGTAGDEKGGWSDEGPSNDLRMLQPGLRRFGNLDFNIIDPAKNRGKSCLVFANSIKPGMLDKVLVPANGARMQYLYLLHTCAWPVKGKNAGTVRVDYVDGTSQEIPVTEGKDVGNWWRPKNLPNAWPVFLAEGESCPEVGFQMSRFRIQEKPVRSISLLKSKDNILWIVLALNGVCEKDIPFSTENIAEKPLNIVPGKEYREMRVSRRIVPESILDFSFLLDAPAGKHGKVVIRNGRFEFEKQPGKQARFFGANLCEDACVMDDREIDVLIPRLVKGGYNAVRFHHYDDKLVLPGSEMVMNPENLDRFFKTFAACKEAGLYATIDLYVSRRNGFPDKHDPETLKALCMLDTGYRDNLKAFARALFTTRNPYTGMTLAEDPAMICVSHINENSQFFNWSGINSARKDSKVHQLFLRRFEEWCKKNKEKNDPENIVLRTRFLTELHRECYQDIRDFLRSIGVRNPQTDMNTGNVMTQYPVRAGYDYTDVHFYIDHPEFPNGPWKIPFEFHDESGGSSFYEKLLHAFASRIDGKPLTITEFHYVIPNSWRLEGGPMIGALSGMHEIDGLFDFSPLGYDRSWVRIMFPDEPTYLGGSFTVFSDPATTLCNRITELLYLRGDMPPATGKYSLSLPDLTKNDKALTWMRPERKNKFEVLPFAFQRLALLYGTSIKFGVPESRCDLPLEKIQQNSDWNSLLKRFGNDPEKELISGNGCIRAFPQKNRFIVCTPRTETVTIEEKSGKANLLEINGNQVFSTYAASAMDDSVLEKSKRVLILHITDVKCGNSKFTKYRNKLRVYGWGAHPVLLRKAKASVSLRNTAQGKAELYAIDITGKRLGNVPFTEKDGVLTFTADNSAGDIPAIGYELIRK